MKVLQVLLLRKERIGRVVVNKKKLIKLILNLSALFTIPLAGIFIILESLELFLIPNWVTITILTIPFISTIFVFYIAIKEDMFTGNIGSFWLERLTNSFNLENKKVNGIRKLKYKYSKNFFENLLNNNYNRKSLEKKGAIYYKVENYCLTFFAIKK